MISRDAEDEHLGGWVCWHCEGIMALDPYLWLFPLQSYGHIIEFETITICKKWCQEKPQNESWARTRPCLTFSLKPQIPAAHLGPESVDFLCWCWLIAPVMSPRITNTTKLWHQLTIILGTNKEQTQLLLWTLKFDVRPGIDGGRYLWWCLSWSTKSRGLPDLHTTQRHQRKQ